MVETCLNMKFKDDWTINNSDTLPSIQQNPFNSSQTHPFNSSQIPPFNSSQTHPFNSSQPHPFNSSQTHPFNSSQTHPFNSSQPFNLSIMQPSDCFGISHNSSNTQTTPFNSPNTKFSLFDLSTTPTTVTSYKPFLNTSTKNTLYENNRFVFKQPTNNQQSSRPFEKRF